LNIFDISIAPTLLFYSYIPIIIISLLFGFFVLFKDGRSLKGKLIWLISFSFTLWVLNILVQWIAAPVALVHFAWELTALFEVLIFTFSVYFSMVFVKEQDISFRQKIVLFSPLLATCALLPTYFNAKDFDLANCQSDLGYLWIAIYALEIISVLFVVMYGIVKTKQLGLERKRNKQIIYTLSGVALFLMIFSLSNIVGQVTQVYEINLVGPIGMVLFLSILTYTIIKYKTFNIKLIGAQALVVALTALVFGLLFIRKIENVRIVVIVTLIFFVILGYQLIRGVKREINQRERIEKLAADLEKSNTRLKELDVQKTEFVSFATHQLRSPLASIKGNTSNILEGDTGPIPETMKPVLETIYTSIKTMGNIVEDYLNMSRLELGTMKYSMVDMDFKDLLHDVMSEQKVNIEAKGLTYSLSVDEAQTFKVKADPDKFKQVIMNTIDNSIKYTPKGSLSVSLTKDSAKKVIRLKIADTGVGIKAEVMPKLFRKFSRAPDASAANIHGTGLGLFIAKEMMNAHHGRIWAESEGEGKGSQFYVEMPEA
jgi:signal transduction histidine kinase